VESRFKEIVMFRFTPSRIPTSKPLFVGRSSAGFAIGLLLTCVSLAGAPIVRAVTPSVDTAGNPAAPELTLVFSDDFSTDPNTNGQWTIHRYEGDPKTEAVWDSKRQAWGLTRARNDLGVAVFANYELTATTWIAEFSYRADKLGGLQNGGDGFVFMFYKNKSAYGTPALGAAKGFDLSNGTVVKGYGLEFDNYIEGCDPVPTDFFALIQDDVCSFLGGREFDWIGDGNWHLVSISFTEGAIRLSIDRKTIFDTQLTDPDYSFSGVGFGAGTGSAYGDYKIDDFRLWVAE
jgi:hypothetical protein